MWYRQLKQEQDKRALKKGIATWQYLFDRPSNDDFSGSIIFVVGKSPMNLMEPIFV